MACPTELGNAELNAERKCSEWKPVNDSFCPCELQQVKGQKVCNPFPATEVEVLLL
jgi:hypothetical protein